jgi:hypothetical protein
VPSKAVAIASPCSRAVAGALRARGQNTACAAPSRSGSIRSISPSTPKIQRFFHSLGGWFVPDARWQVVCVGASGTSNPVTEAL